MPPGSLSTLAVMNPGPNTAKNASMRNLIMLPSFCLRGFFTRSLVVGRLDNGTSLSRISIQRKRLISINAQVELWIDEIRLLGKIRWARKLSDALSRKGASKPAAPASCRPSEGHLAVRYETERPGVRRQKLFATTEGGAGEGESTPATGSR